MFGTSTIVLSFFKEIARADGCQENDTLRICMISNLDITNATTRRALSVAKVLVKKKHQVFLILPAPYGITSLKGLEENKYGVSILHSRFFGRSLIPGKSVAWPEVLARTLDMLQRGLELEFDLVHAFKPTISGAIGILIRRLKGKPLLIDFDDWEGRGGYADSYPRFSAVITDALEKTMPKHCDAITTASQLLAERNRNLGISAEKIFYIPNGVDHERFSPRIGGDYFRELYSLGDSPAIAYSGAIQKSNDVDLLIGAFSRVVQAFPNAKCFIGGEGTEPHTLEKLRARAKTLGLSTSVIFTGWIPNSLYPRFLAMADILVVPTRDSLIHRAACHLKIVEYMSMGKPVIAGKVGEASNYIEHMRSGLLVNPGDPQQLADAMMKLLQDRRLADAIGQNARKRVLDKYTWNIISSDFERVYERLV